MNKQPKGFVLPMTLIVNSVILCLVLTNSKITILNMQLLNAYMKSSQRFYAAEKVLNQIRVTLSEAKKNTCLYEEQGVEDYFGAFKEQINQWCLVQTKEGELYYLIERMHTSCSEYVLFNNKKHAVSRYRINLTAPEQDFNLQSIVVVPFKNKTCPPDSPFAIKDGIQSYRWSHA